MHQQQYPLYHRDNHTMGTHNYTSEYELAQMAAFFLLWLIHHHTPVSLR